MGNITMRRTNKTTKIINTRVVALLLMLILSSLAVVIHSTAQAFSLLAPNTASPTYININSSDLAEYMRTFSSQNRMLKPEVLNLALHAYSTAQQQGVPIRKPIITIIDYSLESTVKRLWVLDLAHRRVLFNTLVAHGKYSGDKYATNFSDDMGSLQSSLGLFVTGDTYDGHNGYTLKVKGLEQGFNANAEERHIVIHGAWYVNEQLAKLKGRIGRSWGCPALEPRVAAPVINTIKDGTLVFAYYPSTKWLQESKFIRV